MRLATIFENRRQLDRAADYLERSRVLHGNGDGRLEKKAARPDPDGVGPVRADLTTSRRTGAPPS